jgi:signal peptidase I
MTSADTPKSLARDYFETIVTCVIFVLFARTFVFQQSKIPTGSMIPTLLIGDYIMVNKFVYAPPMQSVPILGAVERTLFPLREVKRGDIVVFKFPEEPEKDYIKRVIGLPGETIEIRARQVYIDGRPLDESYKVHRNLRVTNIDQDDYPATRIPDNSYFCMGDNRDNSRDSRFWGFLPRDQVKGRALLVYWSYNASREEYARTGVVAWIKDTLSAFGKTRWNRFFHVIR